MEEQGARQPEQAKDSQRAKAKNHGDVFVGHPHGIACAAAISH
jgi:hypothetical protein